MIFLQNALGNVSFLHYWSAEGYEKKSLQCNSMKVCKLISRAIIVINCFLRLAQSFLIGCLHFAIDH